MVFNPVRQKNRNMNTSIGKTALITGGTSGIGLELARRCAKEGYDLILVARDEGGLEDVRTSLEAEYGVKVRTMPKDLMEPGAAEELYQDIRAEGTQIDVLINDAGQGERGRFWEIDLQRHLDIIQLNVTSLTVLTQLVVKDMVARNEGKILQLASSVSLTPGPLFAVYAASKAYVYSLCYALINELKDTNVTMTALLPGATDTDFFHKANAEQTVTYQETELADPADVANDGWEALMKGESRVISGMKNKIQAAMGNVVPDSIQAEQLRKQMEQSDEHNRG